MLAEVDALRAGGAFVAMLSDQTNWLDELDRATALYRHFDRVFNSYRMHKSKRDASVFRDVCGELGAAPRGNAVHRRQQQSYQARREPGIQDDPFYGYR